MGIPIHFPHVALDAFVIMPSHVHGIIVIADIAGAKATRRGAPTEGDVGRHPRGVGQAVAGPRNHIVDRIGEFADAGVEEIIFAPLRDAETAQRVDEEIVAAFDCP